MTPMKRRICQVFVSPPCAAAMRARRVLARRAISRVASCKALEHALTEIPIAMARMWSAGAHVKCSHAGRPFVYGLSCAHPRPRFPGCVFNGTARLTGERFIWQDMTL